MSAFPSELSTAFTDILLSISVSDYIFEMVEKDRHDSDKPDSGPMLAKEITETKGRRLDVGL
ncbi:MAG: hypothetical protein PHY05_07455 [Methanothrix sp.]|nr:hypothetical protein [Methanothrix sp.]